MFNGFSSIHAYEQACSNLGFVTKRDKFVKDGEQFLALIITPPKTVSSISSWMLFSKDETVIDGGIINGIDANYLGKLKAAGYVKI